MNKNEVLSSLEILKHNLKENYNVVKIGLFGSYSRNQENHNSDVDIIFEVDKEAKFSMFKYLKLNKLLEDTFHLKVDLVRESNVKESLKPYIQKDVIYV
jgi:predicted nucleotidyltransferase